MCTTLEQFRRFARQGWAVAARAKELFEELDAWRRSVLQGGCMGGKQGRANVDHDFTHHTQCGEMDCGLACLRMVRDWRHLKVSERQLRGSWFTEKGIDPKEMPDAIRMLFKVVSPELLSRKAVKETVEQEHTYLSGRSSRSLLLLLISCWDEDGYNPRHWVIARDFRKLSNEFSIKGASELPKGRELVALVHDPLQTRPYRQAWASLLASPVLHGIWLTKPEAG